MRSNSPRAKLDHHNKGVCACRVRGFACYSSDMTALAEIPQGCSPKFPTLAGG
jgi:hypothetical protein